MDYLSLKKSDFPNVCRTCLLRSSNLVSVYEVYYKDILLHTIIKNKLNLTIDKEDNLPTQMCMSCIQLMFKMHEFMEMSQRSETVLQHVKCYDEPIIDCMFIKEEEEKKPFVNEDGVIEVVVSNNEHDIEMDIKKEEVVDEEIILIESPESSEIGDYAYITKLPNSNDIDEFASSDDDVVDVVSIVSLKNNNRVIERTNSPDNNSVSLDGFPKGLDLELEKKEGTDSANTRKQRKYVCDLCGYGTDNFNDFFKHYKKCECENESATMVNEIKTNYYKQIKK